MPRATSTDELIQQVYRKATGELDTTVTHDSEDGQTILSVINEQIDYYYNVTDRYGERVVWQRNVDPEYSLGDVTGSETEIEIDWEEVQAFPDGFYMPIRLVKADGSGEIRYDLVPVNMLYDYRHDNANVCAISANGLSFAAPPVAGEIFFPCVVRGGHLDGTETDVEEVSGVHNLQWLAFSSAAEYVRTDIVRGDQYPNVLSLANDVLSRMISDNEAFTQALTYDTSASVSCDW